MRKIKTINLLFYVFIFINFSKSQSVITFNKVYDNLNINNSVYSQIENDSGYLICGSGSTAGSTRYMCLFQVDFSGNVLWTKNYGNPGSEGFVATGIFKNPIDSGYFIGGVHFDFINDLEDGFVGKINSQGDTLWTNKLRIAQKKNIMSECILSSDGNIALGGMNYDTNSAGQTLLPDFCFMKADTMGNFVASKIYPNPGDDVTELTMAETPGHGYMIVGFTNSSTLTNGGYDFLVIHVDSVGNLIWQQAYGSSANEYGAGIAKLNDGNYLLMGSMGVGASVGRGGILKIDINGSVIWQRTYNLAISGISEWLVGACELPNGDIVTVGNSTNNPSNHEGGWVMRLDSLGNKKWERYFKWNLSSSTVDNLYNVMSTSDGGFLFSGFAKLSPTVTQDAWLWKLDENGCDSVGCATVFTGIEERYEDNNQVIAYPNPFKGNSITLTLPIIPQDGKIEVTFFNNLGQQALTTEAFAYYPARITIYDDKLLELPAGMYFVQLKTKKGVYSAKVLKQ